MSCGTHWELLFSAYKTASAMSEGRNIFSLTIPRFCVIFTRAQLCQSTAKCWRSILGRLAAGSTHLCLDSSRVDANHLNVLISQSLHGAARLLFSSRICSSLPQAGKEQARQQQSFNMQDVICWSKLTC